MTLPPSVASSSRKIQAAFVAYATDPARQLTDIANEVGLSLSHVSRVKNGQKWDQLTATRAQEQLDRVEDLDAKMAEEAHRSRRGHLALNSASQKALEYLLNQFVEFDGGGEPTGLREDVIVGRKRDGTPITGKPSIKDGLALVQALRAHWSHTRSVAGVDLRERIELSSQRDPSPVVCLNIPALPAPPIKVRGAVIEVGDDIDRFPDL